MNEDEKVIIGSIFNNLDLLWEIEGAEDYFSDDGRKLIKGLRDWSQSKTSEKIDFLFLSERSGVPLKEVSDLISAQYVDPTREGFKFRLERIKSESIVREGLSKLNSILREYARTGILQKDEILKLIRMISYRLEGGGIKILNLKQIKEEPVNWIWPRYIPLRKVTALGGLAGIGKTTFLIDLISRLTLRRTAPDGSPLNGDRILILNGEHELADVVKHKISLAGGDEEKIFCFSQNENSNPIFLDDETSISKLIRVIREYHPDLLICDPFFSFLKNTKLNEAVSVRQVLNPLLKIANDFNVGVVIVIHLNKSELQPALFRFAGSHQLIAAAHSAFILGRHPQERERRVLAAVKVKLCAEPPAISFTFDQDGIPTDYKVEEQIEADDVTRPLQPESPYLVDRACNWLKGFLADGPKPAREIFAEAQKQGLSEITVRRAKNRLNVRSECRGSFNNKVWYWGLNDDFYAN